MRAIFLDIDGVICCNQFGRLEDRKLQLLRAVVQQTGAKIVLSTDWRRVPKLKSTLIATLRDYGMEVIGSTPMRAPWQPIRPQEIVDWLAAYNASAVAGSTCTAARTRSYGHCLGPAAGGDGTARRRRYGPVTGAPGLLLRDDPPRHLGSDPGRQGRAGPGGLRGFHPGGGEGGLPTGGLPRHGRGVCGLHG